MDPKKTFADLRREARELGAVRWSRRELAQVALLKGAHQETIAPLLRDCGVRTLAAGDVLLRAGEPCEALHMVLGGRLRMSDPASNIPDVYIAAGDCIGELFLLERTVLAWTVSAVESTRVLSIGRATAWTLIRASHEIAQNWLALLAQRTQVGGTVAGAEVLKTAHAQQATHDEVTGLNNRRWLESTLARQIARSSANNTALGLLLVEIDDYAGYVTRLGAAAGEHACRIAADVIVKNLRPTDLTACYGTAQFAAVLPESDAASTCRVGERLRQAISRAQAVSSEGHPLQRFTISVGATQLRPHADASAVLAAADAALHIAKASGGDRVGMRD